MSWLSPAHRTGYDRPPSITRRRPDALALLGLGLALIVGAIARFTAIDVIDWSSDHTAIASLALDLVERVRFPLIGLASSAGLPHSPLFVYVPALAYAWTTDPVVVTGFVSLLNLLGVALLWVIAYRYAGGARVAFIAAFAYAANPWAVAYSRTIWSGDHRAPLFLAAMLIGLIGFVERKRWAQVLFLPLFATAIQTHYAAWSLLPVALWLIFAGPRVSPRQPFPRWALALSVLLALAVVAPFIVGLILHMQAASLEAVHPQPRDLSLRALLRPIGQFVWVATGLGSEQYSARTFAAALVARERMVLPLWWLQGAAIALGWVVMWRRFPPVLSVLLALWTTVTLVAFSIPIVGVFPHYFLPVIPALCLLAGVGLDWLLTRITAAMPARPMWPRLAAVSVFALFGLIWASQVRYTLIVRGFVNTVYTPTQFGFGTPVRHLEAVAEKLAPFSRVVFVTGTDWVETSRTGSSVFKVFLRRTASCLSDVHAGAGMATVPAAPFALVWSPRVDADPFLEAVFGPVDWQSHPLRQGEGEYRLGRVDLGRETLLPGFQPIDDASSPPSMRTTASAPAFALTGFAPSSSASSSPAPLALTGYRVYEQGLLLHWQVVATATRDLGYAVSFRDEAGREIGQHTATLDRSATACVTDRLVVRVPGPMPRGTRNVAIRSTGQTSAPVLIRLPSPIDP